MRFLAILLIALLAACGGGNGNTPNGDLKVAFSGYQTSSATTYKAVSFAPTVSDLNGNQPTYSVVSGSLPAGLSLNPNTGVVSGVLTGSGASTAQIELTVQGFSGSLSAPFSLTVNAASLTYTGSSGSSSPTAATTFEVGAPIRPLSVFMMDPAVLSNGILRIGPLQPDPSVAITYRVANGSALPNGLALETTTGAISGTPATEGVVNAQVEALVRYGGATQTYSATIPFSIVAPTASLAYKPQTRSGELCISSLSAPFASAPTGGTPITFTPVLSGSQPGDTLSNFNAAAGSLAGLSLNPNTGIISGTSFAPNNFCGTVVSQFDVTYTLTRGNYSSRLTTHLILVQ